MSENQENHRQPPTEEPLPCLLFLHNSNKGQTFCSLTEPGSHTRNHRRSIPELYNKTIMACCEDWLVLSDTKTDHHYSLWNQSTLELIDLPPLKLSNSFVAKSCALSSPPGTPNSILMLFHKSRHDVVYFRFGSCDEWKEKQFGMQLDNLGFATKLFNQFYTPTCCNGMVYVISFCNDLFRFEFIEETNELILRTLKTSLPGGYLNYRWHDNTSLVESAGELYTVRIFVHGFKWDEPFAVEVFKLDMLRMEWHKVPSINDRVFFLGDNWSISISCSTSCELKKGCIYFWLASKRYIFSYNVEERTSLVASYFPKLPDPSSSLSWFLPFQRTGSSGCKEVAMVANDYKGTYIKESTGHGYLVALPQDLQLKIAENLILPDYMNFRAACREFKLAAPADQWRKTSLHKHSLSPWLVFIGKDRKVLSFIDAENNEKYFIRMPSELEDANIHCSKDGWLLMSRKLESVFFFNPFTKVALRWPDLCVDSRNPVSGLVFLSVPTSEDCFILGMSNKHCQVSTYSIFYGEEWNYDEFEDVNPLILDQNAPVFWNDEIYCLGQDGMLGVLSPEEESYTWAVLDELKPPCEDFRQSFLVTCDKKLLSVFVGELGRWVKVYMFDNSEFVWEEVFSVGNQTIYLSNSSSFSALAKSKEMENRIYFPRLHGESLVFYSLETRKFHSSRGDSIDYATTRHQLLCGWIEPHWDYENEN